MSYKISNDPPEDLFINVERKLSTHIRKKKQIKNGCKILITLLLFISFFNYEYFISFASEFIYGMDKGIFDAIENNKATRINKKFTVDNITFDFDSIAADETGMAVLYHVSDKEGIYDISDYKIFDQSGKDITKGLNVRSNKISSDASVIYIPYIKGNSIKININKITKIIFNDKNEYTPVEYKTDWTLPLNYKTNKVKIVKINKELPIENGKIVIESIGLGVLRSRLEYKFIQNNNDKADNMTPKFTIKSGNKYYETSFNYDNNNRLSPIIDFEPIIYDNIKNLEIMLESIAYSRNINKEFVIKKSDIPKELELLGDKFKITKYETYTAKVEKLPKFMRESIEKFPELEPYITKRTDLYIDISSKNRHYDKYYVLVHDNASRDKMSEIEIGAYIHGGYNFYEIFNKVDHYNQPQRNEALIRIGKFIGKDTKDYGSKAQTRVFTSTCGNHNTINLKFEAAEATKYYGQKINVAID